jgi:hypothetical protein
MKRKRHQISPKQVRIQQAAMLFFCKHEHPNNSGSTFEFHFAQERIVMGTRKTFVIGLAMSALTTPGAFAQDSTRTCHHEPRAGAFATQPRDGAPCNRPQDQIVYGTPAPAQAPSVTAHPRDRHAAPGFALRPDDGNPNGEPDGPTTLSGTGDSQYGGSEPGASGRN